MACIEFIWLRIERERELLGNEHSEFLKCGEYLE
jgi:hypothetical protein